MEVMKILRSLKDEMDWNEYSETGKGDTEDEEEEEDVEQGGRSDDELDYQHKYIKDMAQQLKKSRGHRHKNHHLQSSASAEWDMLEDCHNKKYLNDTNPLHHYLKRCIRKARKTGDVLLKSDEDIPLISCDKPKHTIVNKGQHSLFSCQIKKYNINSECKIPPLIPLTTEVTAKNANDLSQKSKSVNVEVPESCKETVQDLFLGFSCQLPIRSDPDIELKKLKLGGILGHSLFLFSDAYNDKDPAVFRGEPCLKRCNNFLELNYHWTDMITPNRVKELIDEMKLYDGIKKRAKETRIIPPRSNYFNSDTQIKMSFVRVEESDMIVMKIIDREFQAKYDKLREKMNFYYSVGIKKLAKGRLRRKAAKPGVVVAACTFVEQGLFERVKILKSIQKEQDDRRYFLVESVDNGKEYEILLKNLFLLPDELLDLPFLINAYELDGLSFYMGTGLIYKHFEEILGTHKNLFGTVTTMEGDSSRDPKLLLDLFAGPKHKCSHVNYDLLLSLMDTLKQSVPQENMDEGFISCLSSDGTFWFHKENEIVNKVLNDVIGSETLKLKNLKQETLLSISEDFIKDQMYVARWIEDNQFYRGKIMEVYDTENQVLIHFLDLGLVVKIPISDVYKANDIDDGLGIIPPQVLKHRTSAWNQNPSEVACCPLKEKLPVSFTTNFSLDLNGFRSAVPQVLVHIDAESVPLEDYIKNSSIMS